MRTPAAVMLLFMLFPAAATHSEPPALARQQERTAPQCGAAGTAHARTTLYFGLTRPTGTVSEAEWRAFVREQVTPRFPDGLTVWEAEGQWRRPDGRVARERSKVLLLVHDDTPAARATLSELVVSYKRLFEQESVLWESAHVCATF